MLTCREEYVAERTLARLRRNVLAHERLLSREWLYTQLAAWPASLESTLACGPKPASTRSAGSEERRSKKSDPKSYQEKYTSV
jgi:hypothetical protein